MTDREHNLKLAFTVARCLGEERDLHDCLHEVRDSEEDRDDCVELYLAEHKQDVVAALKAEEAPATPQGLRERSAATGRWRSYRASPINRRGQQEIEYVKDAIFAIVNESQPMTLRQVFYQAVGLGVVEKTESEYNHTVGRLLVEMRRAGEVPYDWVSDNTRWIRKPDTFTSIEHALYYTAQHYRRDMWHELNVHVEVYREKDALAGVLAEETDPYDVPLMVFRGFGSRTCIR